MKPQDIIVIAILLALVYLAIRVRRDHGGCCGGGGCSGCSGCSGGSCPHCTKKQS